MTGALDDVRVERALCEERHISEVARLALEHANELVAEIPNAPLPDR